MYYVLIVLLTFLQTVLMTVLMGFPFVEPGVVSVRLWGNYLAAALIIWSPMLFTDKRRWTYAVSVLLDVWFIGNLMYFRSYGDVLNRWCLLNISNMDGIWSAVLPFLRWSDLLFVAATVIWVVISEWAQFTVRWSKYLRAGIACLCLVLCCTPQLLVSHRLEMPLSPFASYYADLSMGRIWYMHTYGAITHLSNETVQLIRGSEAGATPVQADEMSPLGWAPTEPEQPANTVLVLFESLEEQVIGLQVNGEEVTPTLNRLIANPHTGHYALQAQVKEGKSSDAQLIIFTGLLPIYNGATSMRYAQNAYPSWVRYSQAATKRLFDAYPEYMWNQQMNAQAYGFDSIYAANMSDRDLFAHTRQTVLDAPRPFIVTAVTMASHSPFLLYADSSSLSFTDEAYDATQRRYLQCVHYTDEVLGTLIETILEDSVLAATTRIIVTGDHPILDIDHSVPFIIYDPFTDPETATRPLYQMDIYPTLIERMHIPTPWHGVGHAFSDSTSCGEMEQWYRLSDRLIRTNYFAE